MSGVLVSKSSTATIGELAPQEVIISADDDSIKIGDGLGHFVGINDAGEMKVAGLPSFDTQDVRVLFDKTSSPIAIGIETLINTYTAPPGVTSYLLSIRASGENRAEYNVYLDNTLLDQEFTNVTELKTLFDYKTGSGSVPGVIIPTSSVLEIKATNNGTTTANYSARFLILEVT